MLFDGKILNCMACSKHKEPRPADGGEVGEGLISLPPWTEQRQDRADCVGRIYQEENDTSTVPFRSDLDRFNFKKLETLTFRSLPARIEALLATERCPQNSAEHVSHPPLVLHVSFPWCCRTHRKSQHPPFHATEDKNDSITDGIVDVHSTQLPSLPALTYLHTVSLLMSV